MNTISFSFDHSKGMSNMELSSYFRSEAIKLKSKENIDDSELLSIFSESLKFITKNLDDFLLSDLINLIRICWHENSNLIWEKNSSQLINISKKVINGMIIIASISRITVGMKDSLLNSASKAFFEQFVHDCFNEINENLSNIENRACDSFLVFDQVLSRKKFLFFLFELIQSIPYSESFISKYLQILITEMPLINIYSLYSFFIINNLIFLLPREIFTDQIFLEYATLPISLVLLNEINDDEFMIMFQFYYRKINHHKYNNSEIAYSFLERLSKINSEQIINFMNKSSSDESKSRIQIMIDFAAERDFSKDLLLNLKQYKFRLPESVSKKIKSLEEDQEYLSLISYNPLLYMDRSKLDPILLSSQNPNIYSNIFRFFKADDPLLKNLQFWSHLIPLFKKNNIQQSQQLMFIQADPTTVSKRISNLFLFNFPQNMKSDFFDFAKRILTQENLSEFTNSDETKILLSQIQNYVPYEFWKLFTSPEPILSVIDKYYDRHLPLTLGLSYFLIYQYRVHASPPDPQIKTFKVADQTEESIQELSDLVKNNINLTTDFSNLSTPALSVVTAAYLYSSFKLNKFFDLHIEGLNDDIFLPFFIIVVNNISSIGADFYLNENDNYRLNNRQHETPILGFLSNSIYSKKLITLFDSIEYENPNLEKNNIIITSVLNLFINLNDNIAMNANEPLHKILKIFSEHLDFYLGIDSPNSKIMAHFYAKLLTDISKWNQSKKQNNSQALIKDSTQSYIVRLLIEHPFDYSSKPLDSQVINRVILEEKEKGNKNVNIIQFLMNDTYMKDKKTILYFNDDELLTMANKAIEENDEKKLKTIINYGKDHFPNSFAPLLNQKIPIDIKFTILSKMIPTDSKYDTRKSVSIDTLISVIKEVKNISSFKKLFDFFFYFLLDEPTMINYYYLQFEGQYDFAPMADIKRNPKLGLSEFETAFKKFFQIMTIGKKKCIIKRPHKPELEQPSEFTIQFLNILIDDFMNHPTWQILTTLYFIAANLPFLFLNVDRVESIFQNLFELFKIFEKYQQVPFSQKLAYNKKQRQTNNNNNNNNAFNDRPINPFNYFRIQIHQNHDNLFHLPFLQVENYNNDEDLNNTNQTSNDNNNSSENENDVEIGQMKNDFYAAHAGLYFLNAFISIPKITDQFFKWSLTNFSRFSQGQVVSFISTLIPVINRETAKHVAATYLIKYDWVSLFTKYYEKIDKPVTKFSRYILANMLRITYAYFIKYIHSFTPEMAATCDELMKYDNPFEISYDYKYQISPIFSPWMSIKEYEIKIDQNRNILSGIQLNLEGNPRTNMFTNQFPFIPGRLNPIRQNGNLDRPINFGRLDLNNDRPNNDTERPINDAERSNAETRILDDVIIGNTGRSNTDIDNSNENSNLNTDNTNANSNSDNINSNTENTNTENANQNTDNRNTERPGTNLRRPLIPMEVNPFRIIRGHPTRNITARNAINRLLSSNTLRHVISNLGPRLHRDLMNNRPPHRQFHLHGLSDVYLNNLRANDAAIRSNDENYNLQFWSIFHLTDDEISYLKDSIFSGDGVVINYSANKSLTSHQINSLITPNEPLDLSVFDRIQNGFAFSQLDQTCQSLLLRNEIKVPPKVTPRMQRYLINEPQWITAFISYPPKFLLTPQHYVVLQRALKDLKHIQDEEGDETEKDKKFLSEFLSEIHAKCEMIIDLFLSPRFTLPFLSNYGLRKGMVCKTSQLLTGILRELASADNKSMDLILEKISNGISQLNPMHIEQLLHILVSLLRCSNFNCHFPLSLLHKLIQVAGSPFIQSQLEIIETTASLLIELSNRFYTKLETKDPCSYSDIEKNTLQVFSILLNSPDLQAVNKAMDLIVRLTEVMKSKLAPVILAKFDSIYDEFCKIENDDDAVTSFIFSDSSSQSLTSLFISSFITKFTKLPLERKPQLLSILRRILKLKNKNITLISNLINCLVPKRQRIKICNLRKSSNNSNDNDNNNNNNNNENSIISSEVNLNDEKYDDNIDNINKILIPPCYYNESPEFWEIIFDNLSWFQEQVNQTPSILEDKFKFLKNYMELLTFKQKSVFFRQELYNNKIQQQRSFELQVRRKDILADSFYKLRPSSSRSVDRILSNIHIKFTDEPGFDMGGLTRDWFTSLVKELFNPNYALFIPSENCRSYQPNPSSSVNDHHLQYFEFAGLIIARAIIAGICVDAHLTTSFIKQILGVEVTLRDLEDVDKQLHDSLVWILNNSVKDVDIRFTTGFQDIDTTKTVELIENGDNIVVTDENKKQFVKLLCQHRMTGQIKDQIEAFLTGFYKLISREEILLFTPTELDLLICGVPEIDTEDLRKNCDFCFPYAPEHPVIKMFFNVISKWGHEDLAKLLLFITGSSQVPIGGFKMMKESNQPIIIAPGGDSSRLPQAHTCMNTLDLPNYSNEEILEKKLLLSISECKNFGFN